MNRILKYSIFIAGLFMAAGITSCVKNRNSLNTDFSDLQPLVELRTPPPNVSGLLNFGTATLLLAGKSDPDTTLFYVNLASVAALNKGLTVNVDFDNAALTAYNNRTPANPSDTIKYEKYPDSTFIFTEKQVTISAGQHVVPMHLIFHTDKIDFSKNYMLPITIKGAEGINISANFGTIYYHQIGNPLAGPYLRSFSRWNSPATDTTTPPNSTNYVNHPVTGLPENGTTLLLPEDYLQTFVGSFAGISLSFDNNNGVLSNFSVSLNAATKNGLDGGGFVVLTTPKLVAYQIVGNASTKYAGSTFRTYMVVQNSSGGIRTLIDNFVKQ